MSRDRAVDPVGACVGIRGSRIQNVVQELKGERIDIVVWSPDIAMYAQHALSPAVITRITVDDEEEALEVVCPDDQLSLAIGRKGQNVKLAAKLLGWKIDIFTESRYGEANASRKGMDQIASVAEIGMDNFFNAGFESIESIIDATEEELLEVKGLTESKIADIRVAINMLGIGNSDETEFEEAEEQIEEVTEEATEEVAEEVTEEISETEDESETPAEGEETK